MPQTVVAFLEDEDRNGAATGIAAVADDLFNISGDNLQVRNDFQDIALTYFWTEFAAYPPVLGVLSSPSIAQNPFRVTKGIALNYMSEGQIYDWRTSPYARLRPNEDITFTGYEADEAGVNHFLALVMILVGAGQRIPISPSLPTNHILRVTGGATTAATWTKITQTVQDELPAGRYAMLGARVEGATAVAARFIIKGKEERPAVIPVSRAVDNVHPFSRWWGKPYWFQYPEDLPNLEYLATTTDTTEIDFYLHDPEMKVK